MTKRLAGWAYSVLCVVGVVLVAAFFLAWVDLGESASGFTIARENHWLFLVPISGAALLAAASTKSQWTRLSAVGAGLLIAGDMGFEMLKGMLHMGMDGYLMIGGAVALLVGSSEKMRGLRGIGGLAILVGFVAPWSDNSMFAGLRASRDFAEAFGLSVAPLWLIPLAGIGGLVSTGMKGPRSRSVALVSGLAVFAGILWVIGSVANLVFAWGAWATLGASATALVVGLLAPTEVVKSQQLAE